MTVRNLDSLFRPRSVAVIGASNRPASVGAILMRNMMQAGFGGPVMPVNPKQRAVAGVLAYPSVAELPLAPDLAVISTPPQTVPGLIGALAERGTRAAVVITAGLSDEHDARGQPLDRAALAGARPHLLRILGPNCVGLLAPHAGLNASFAHAPALPGRIAFVSQSGALCTVVLDWARARGIGFSYFVSLGNALDVDFGDAIDWLGSDPQTSAILLYIESISAARKFVSAARAASRNKPIVAIKAGRVAEGAQAAHSHTGALAGADDVIDYALRRAGVLRVDSIGELFAAVETLARSAPLRGNRLAILTNGGGPGVIATDVLVRGGGTLARLADETLQRLDAVLPKNWSRGNPIDVIGDATAERFGRATAIAAADPGVDALLALYAPTALTGGEEVAQAVVAAARGARVNVLVSWLGGDGLEAAQRRFAEAGIPSYATPEDAVLAFLHLIGHRRSQELLRQTPPAAPADHAVDPETARGAVQRALDAGSAWLAEPDAKRVLEAYGITTVETRTARDPDAASAVAEQLGYPVALKVLSPDVLHKSDVGGVHLDLESAGAVRDAAHAMVRRLRELRPEAQIEGFTVQRMARRPGAHELLVGAAVDPTFGPFVMFGRGGIAVEVIADRAVALPPLDVPLAMELISRTRVWRLLQGYRNRPAADVDAICRTLVRVSRLIADVPEIVELDINPLLADERGVLALDARIRVERAEIGGAGRLAIRPYPNELEEAWELSSGERVTARPIRPEDEAAHREFFARLSPDDVLFRYFSQIREMPPGQLARSTQIDYDREMAFIATCDRPEGGAETLGVVRAITDPDNEAAEFAIVVRSDLKGHGLGKRLLEKLIRYCKARGTKRLVGRVRRDNARMLRLAESLGFEVAAAADDDVEVRLAL